MISKNRPSRGRIGTPYHIERIYPVKSKHMESASNAQIARTMKNAIEQGYDLKRIAKSLNTSLYNALSICNNAYGVFWPMNDENIEKLRKYGLSKDRIADLYNVERSFIHNKLDNKESKSSNKKIKHQKPKSKTKYIQPNTNTKSIQPIKSKLSSENEQLVKKASNSICDLCKSETIINVYYIDKNKREDIDSILNLVVLCDKCRKKSKK